MSVDNTHQNNKNTRGNTSKSTCTGIYWQLSKYIPRMSKVVNNGQIYNIYVSIYMYLYMYILI